MTENKNKIKVKKVCALRGCENVINQSLGDVIEDNTNEKEVINQAELLLMLGFNKSDYFCQECFWK